MNDAPKLLIEWSSPWAGFLSSVRPALERSRRPLAGEAHTGLFPYNGMLLSWTLESSLLVAAIVLPGKMSSMHPYTPPALPKYEPIYFSRDELPQTEDLGGAQAGHTGRAGGQIAHHRTQTIRVTRGDSPTEEVVDVPKLNLPRFDTPVANLLLVPQIPAAAPAEGLKSSLKPAALPKMTVVAPAPDVSRDQMRAAPALHGTVIPPSPQLARDKMQGPKPLDIGVVPPAPTDTPRDVRSMGVRVMSSTNVVPPPVSTPQRETNVDAKLLLPPPNAIAPPPNVTRELGSFADAEVTDVRRQVVPPPVQVGDQFSGRKPGGIPGGTGDVVPPPPTVSRGSLTGTGRGAVGIGLGGPLDAGSALAPPRTKNSENAGVVISNQPGQRHGLPGTGGTGSLVLSPAGGGKTGIGGNGLGSGIGRGSGPGSGMAGEATGAATTGTGRGSDPASHPGISPYTGPGGAGKERAGLSVTPGISVRGGNTPTIPSFEADAPTVPGRSGTSYAHDDIDVIVEGTARSGGGFNYYGKLPGQNYTMYIPTTIGPAVMQYADATSMTQDYTEGLTAPKTIRIDLPPGLQHLHISVACILDRSGQLQNLRLLDSAGAGASANVLAALHSWKFIPAKRGDEPVEVNAILGFNIDTR